MGGIFQVGAEVVPPPPAAAVTAVVAAVQTTADTVQIAQQAG